MAEVSKEDLEQSELAEWKDHPMTRRLMAWARREQEELKRAWVNGDYSYPTIEAAMLKNAEKIGEHSQLEKVLNIEVSDLFPAEQD